MELKKEILEILRMDAKIQNKNIAAMLGVTEEQLAAAIQEMEEDGIILHYGITLNSELLGEDAPAEALIEIKVAPKRDFGYDDIARRIYKFPEVKALYLMSGRCDLAIRVECKGMKDISKFVWEKLSVLEGVTSTETLFIMRKYKEDGEILVGGEKEDRLVVTP